MNRLNNSIKFWRIIFNILFPHKRITRCFWGLCHDNVSPSSRCIFQIPFNLKFLLPILWSWIALNSGRANSSCEQEAQSLPSFGIPPRIFICLHATNQLLIFWTHIPSWSSLTQWATSVTFQHVSMYPVHFTFFFLESLSTKKWTRM